MDLFGFQPKFYLFHHVKLPSYKKVNETDLLTLYQSNDKNRVCLTCIGHY